MKTPPTISEAEWQVMKVVWAQEKPCSAQTIIEAVAAPNDWTPATIKTLLNRLVRKGALTFTKQGKAYLYEAAVSQAECRSVATDSFLERFFDGSLSPLIAHFAKARKLRKQDIAELEALLRENKGK